jgi:Tol biopolymer transport system component
VSRDGKRLTYGTDDGKDAAVWIYDLSGANAPQRLTFQGASRYPVWSPDGQRVAFQWDREGDSGIFWQRADAAGTAERLTQPEKGVAHIPDSFSPDGKYLSFTRVVQPGSTSVWILSMSDRKAALFAESPGSLIEASVFSPDGKWIAYSTPNDGSGIEQVYLKPFPATAGKYQIARGAHPAWSRDGKQLLFSMGPGTLGMVNVSTKGGFTFSSPAALPRGGMIQSTIGPRTYDNLPDGRIVGVGSPVQSGATAGPQIWVVLNWFEDLKQRVPAI